MVRYRYRGRFISEARARALSRLRGPSRFVSTHSGAFHASRYVPPAEAQRKAERLSERARRSEAARRGRVTPRRRLKRRPAAPSPPPMKKIPPRKAKAFAPKDLAWGWDIEMMDPDDTEYLRIVDESLWDLATDSEEAYEVG